jgi:threonine dehydrogenase-like Zn-dependent dehydrogenase
VLPQRRHAVTGVYIGTLDKIPFGVAMNKGLTIKMGQTNLQKNLEPLLKQIEAGEIDPSFVITHRIKLEDAPKAYKTFRDKEDGCIKVVVKLGS